MVPVNKEVFVAFLAFLVAGSALAQEQVSLGKAISLLARQAGYTLTLEFNSKDFLQPISLPPDTQGKEKEVIRSLLEKAVPGKYEVHLDGKVLTVKPKEAKAAPARLLLLGPEVSRETLEMPKIAVGSIVQERIQAQDELFLALNPGEITCVEARGDAVCLRPLAFSGEDEVAVELGGQLLKIRYRIEASPPLLRRISLDGSYAPIGVTSAARPTSTNSPNPPLSILPPGRWALVQGTAPSSTDIVWEGFRLEEVKGGKGESWLTPGLTCQPDRVVRFLSAARGAGARAGIEADGACYRLLVEESSIGKTLLKRLGLSWVRLP